MTETVPGQWKNRIVGLTYESPEELLANPNRWRVHPKPQQDAIGAMLEEVGWIDAIVVNLRTGHVVDGHALTELSMSSNQQSVPVINIDVSPEEEKLILASKDHFTAMAGVDKDQLSALLADIGEHDNDLINELLADIAKSAEVRHHGEKDDPGADLDAAESLQQKWGTARGQLWLIESGHAARQHRLYCGDAADPVDIERLMHDRTAALMATDPPYGVDFSDQKYNPRAKDWDGIEGDTLQGVALETWLCDLLIAWDGYMASDAAWYLWTAHFAEGAASYRAIEAAGLHVQGQIVWVKNAFALGQADYQWSHELCWYAFKLGAKHRWFGGRDQRTTWHVDKLPNGHYTHPMQKPVDLYKTPMMNHTRVGELVCDPFAGSGTSFVAAEQEGRMVYGMEIDPGYVAVALERLDGMGLGVHLA